MSDEGGNNEAVEVFNRFYRFAPLVYVLALVGAVVVNGGSMGTVVVAMVIGAPFIAISVFVPRLIARHLRRK